MKRRVFLQGYLAASTMGMAAITGLLAPISAFAAWPKEAFQAKTLPEVLKSLMGTDTTTEGEKQILIDAPDLADDGSMVRVKVSSNLPDTRSITIVAPKNPVPLIASFQLEPGTTGFIATKIKMAESSDIFAIVKAGDKLYSNTRFVKVTVGGCK